MTTRFPDLRTNATGFGDAAVDRLARDRPVRRSVPGGWLHIDRPLPFLCVYRRPRGRIAEGAERLVLSQAAHLSVSGDPALAGAVGELVEAIARAMTERFGSFLLLELWASAESEAFRVHAAKTQAASTVTVLVNALHRVDVIGRAASVETVSNPHPCPPGLPPLLTREQQRRLGCLTVGVEVPGFFADPSGRAFPLVLRGLQRDLSLALQRAAFEFTTVQTGFRPEDFRALGPRRLLEATKQADRGLADVAGSVDYLLEVTPTDADVAWSAFRDGGFRDDPTFHYRPLAIDPDLLKRALYAVPLEDIDDPTLAAVCREKRHELDRQLSLLEDRCSPAFLPISLQLYGAADADLLALADELLHRLRPSQSGGDGVEGCQPPLNAEAFAQLARAEAARYDSDDAGLPMAVTVRDDVPGVLVSGESLLVGSAVQISGARANALIQHEVGTHIVTEANGRVQPLRLLQVGLPGHEETQEALAVLAEYVVGGLTTHRLVTLAARVVAVDRLVDGAGFVDTFHDLHDHYRLGPGRAFRVTMRVYRAGGLTKDVIYLRGLVRLLRYLGDGHSLGPLLVGKLPLEYVPVVEELRWRQVVQPPRFRPRWLDQPDSAKRIDAVRAGLTVLDLVPEPPR